MLGMLAGVIDSDRIFKQFDLAARRAVVAAVSGGSDSLALLFLLKDFLDHSAPQTSLVAVTIDHGLRPESASEAEAVAELCRGHGIAHRTLRWAGVKPAAGLPAAAREARYRLLAEAAAAQRSDLVLTGHTLDDQIETVDMRRARGAKGSGDGRGLAGMAPATLYDGRIWIVRPLLDTGRAALRDFLRGRDIAWIDDPTNVDTKYERARRRAATATRSDPGAGVDRRRGAAADRARRSCRRIDPNACPARGSRIDCDRSQLRRRGRSRCRRLCPAHPAGRCRRQRAIARSRAGRHAFRPAAGRRIPRDAVARGGRRASRRDLRQAGKSWPAGRGRRAGSAMSGTAATGSGNCRTVRRSRRSAPLNASALLASHQEGRRSGKPDACRARRRAGAVAQRPMPSGFALDAGAARRIIAPWARFLPSFDLEPARAVAALLGADIPPEPPLSGHKEREG